MKLIIDFLNRPYPEDKDYLSYLKGLAMISLFITFFLFVFQPFNLNMAGKYAMAISIGFGLITFGISIIYDFVLKNLFRIKTTGKQYTLGKWIAMTMGLILAIGITNFLFLQYMLDANVLNLGQMIISTFFIGLFPLVFLGSMAVVRSEKKYTSIAEDLNKKVPIGDVKSILIYGKESSSIRYIESMQNYVRIWYVDGDVLSNKTERATLSTIEAKISTTPLKRCHRSYIVNQVMIEDVKGNAQGLQLSLKDVEVTIPVSRKYVDSFR